MKSRTIAWIHKKQKKKDCTNYCTNGKYLKYVTIANTSRPIVTTMEDTHALNVTHAIDLS